MEGDLTGVRLAKRGEHLHSTGTRRRRNFTHETALADAGWPHEAYDGAVAADRTLQQVVDGEHLPPPPDQIRLNTPDRPILAHAQQAAGGNAFIGTLDANQLRLTEGSSITDESRCGFAEHHPTRRCHRFHPLRHADLLTHSGVS